MEREDDSHVSPQRADLCKPHVGRGNSTGLPLISPLLFDHEGAEDLVGEILPNLRDLAISTGLPNLRPCTIYRSARPMTPKSFLVGWVLNDVLRVKTVLDLRQHHLPSVENHTRATVRHLFPEIKCPKSVAPKTGDSDDRIEEFSQNDKNSENGEVRRRGSANEPILKKRLFVVDVLENEALKVQALSLIRSNGLLPRFAIYKSWDKITGSNLSSYHFCKQFINNGGLLKSYVVMIDMCGDKFAIALRILAKTSLPVLFHCSIGKDRTGLLSMLFLHIIGASEESIVRDYTRTEESSGDFQRHVSGFIRDSGLTEEFSGATPRCILALMDYINVKYTSIDGYLNQIGITENWRKRLRRRFLIDPNNTDDYVH
eukprot:GHVO01044143.1.p1 GENE.GHVO01044143.1~~GHVO01044143.1.p1  ORF type:complete len:372 (+),score=35.74 GHVO01044143.1:52-1167(+)